MQPSDLLLDNNIHTNTSWATRWAFTVFVERGLCIIPGDNLAINIGTDGGAHYENGDINPYAHLKIGTLREPLHFNDNVVLDKRQQKLHNKDFLRIRMIGLKKKIKTIFR